MKHYIISFLLFTVCEANWGATNPPPLAPVLYAPPNGSINSTPFSLIWFKSLTASNYSIELALDSLMTSLIFYDTTLTDSMYVISDGFGIGPIFWRVNARNNTGTSPWSAIWRFSIQFNSINPVGNQIPTELALYQNYPNPFNPATKIKFDIPSSVKSEKSDVKLIIYDALGREITTLVNEQLNSGTYEVEWDASNSPSGVYFYKLEVSDYTETKKMLMVK
jgi:hypothetical protein